MAYITGNQYNFENRLHQFANSTSDLTDFAAEGNTYYNNFHWSAITKLNKEFQKIYYEITGTPTQTNYIQWTPANITNLIYFSQNKAGNCFYNDGNMDQTSSIGDTVHFINQSYGATGTIIDGSNVILRNNGIDPVANSAAGMTLSTAINGDFTIYATQYTVAGSVFIIAGDSGGPSYLAINNGIVFQASGNDGGSASSITENIFSLVYISYNSATGELTANATGAGGYSIVNSSSFNLNRYLIAPGNGENDNFNNRARTFVAVGRAIAYDSVENANILSWFADPANDGATL